ncbi:MAG: hypothetical protein BV457_02875 [Thermoplasmata archaeon M9B1D]|nr:MAG: hypothetical protein BV457_02875 [Thermoplasmata archaeon M9B1D]PNX51411.1 MAG: hypothetical protein BV456_03225 [Thermoplasmata archaeon M8B2D]
MTFDVPLLPAIEKQVSIVMDDKTIINTMVKHLQRFMHFHSYYIHKDFYYIKKWGKDFGQIK